MLAHADLPCPCMPTRHALAFLSDTSSLQSYGLIHAHVSHTYLGIHLLCIPWHLHSFVHFCVYSDLIPTSSQDCWLMPTHLNTPIKSSLNLRLMPNRLIHSHVYSSHLDLTAHDLQLMPDRLKTLSHSSLVSYLFLSTHDDSSQDAFLFISQSISWLVPIHL